MELRDFIKDTIKKHFQEQKSDPAFQDDIPYLHNFKLFKKNDTEFYTIWFFESKQKEYILRFYVHFNKQEKQWKAAVAVYWKSITKELTTGRGKDFENHFGPYSNYKDMVDDLHIKLTNHILLSPNIFIDDNKQQLDTEILNMLKLLDKNKDQIAAVKDPIFKDLKQIMKEIDGISDENERLKYIRKKTEEVNDKQGFMLTLQKLHNLDFHSSLDQWKESGKKPDELRNIIR